MPCTPFRLPDGTRGIICTRSRRRATPPCAIAGCTSTTGFQCDYPVSARKTCDRHLCAIHAFELAREVHYCPEHRDLWEREGAPLQACFDFK